MLDEKQELRLKEIMSQMTLEEKIGQLQYSGGSAVGAFEVDVEELINMVYDGRMTKAELMKILSSTEMDYHEEDLRAGRIGSYGGVNDLNLFLRLQKIAVEESRLGIPLFFGYDVVHGHRTVTPIPLGESCAWEIELWERTARMAAEEAASCGIKMTFAPMVDVAKDARWGRIAESAGEDTLLNGAYGAAKVKGFQGKDLSSPDSIASCMKHFAGYGFSEAGRDYNRVDISIQRLYEEIFPAFKACVKAGVSSVMPAFNDINGVPCSVNSWLLTDVLRKEWGFDGLTISDANAIGECVIHGIAADREDAAKQALEAGMDIDMSSNCYAEHLKTLVETKTLNMNALNRAVEDVIRLKLALGLFDDPYQTTAQRQKDTLISPEKRMLAREAAQKSIVLLKNEEKILPLRLDTHLGIAGMLADNRAEMTGTWAMGAEEEDCISLVDACKTQGVKYTFFNDIENILISDCDVFIAAIGESKGESGEAASRSNIDLCEADIKLLKKLIETGKPVIAVLFNGRPLAIGWLKEKVLAILEAWHPGVEAGNAILDILFGKVNPSAKLTTTFPNAAGQCPMYYDHINTGRPSGKSKFSSKYLDVPSEPVYPFGYGLSYTSFAYSNLDVKIRDKELLVSVAVQNTGSCNGDEIVQCYIHDPVGRRVRPVQKLVDFAKISLAPQESRILSFIIPFEKLGYYDQTMQFVIDDGTIKVMAGGSSVDCLCKEIQIKMKLGGNYA